MQISDNMQGYSNGHLIVILFSTILDIYMTETDSDKNKEAREPVIVLMFLNVVLGEWVV